MLLALLLFWNLMSVKDVIVLEVIYCFIKFWDEMQNFIPYRWQVVFANIFVQDVIVHSYVYSFFYGPCHNVPLPAYDFEVVHFCYVASIALLFKNT